MTQPKFSQYCQTYDKATPIQTDVAFFLARFLAKEILEFNFQTKEQVWLDVGCGTGKLSQAVIGESYVCSDALQTPCFEKINFIGVDKSQEMLKIWQENVIQFKQAIELKTIKADINSLPFADYSFDVLMSSFALHWATPQVIAELGRVVKKGGYIFLAIPVKGSFNQVSQRFPELPIYPFLPSDDWKKAIYQLIQKREGELRFFDERQFSHTYPNLKTLLSELKQMGGAVSGQSPINPTTLRHYLKDTSLIDLDYQILMVGVQLN